MKRLVLALLFTGSVASAAPSANAVTQITTESSRVHYGELVPSASPELAQLDLGPAPGPNGSRLFSRAELEDAARSAGQPTPKLPNGVRVVRKMTSLDSLALQELALRAWADSPRANAALSSIKHAGKAQIPSGWTDVSYDLGKLPRRAGALTTSMALVFRKDGESLGRIDVSANFLLAPEHARPEIARGATVTLAIRRGDVEITTPAITTRDGDTGDVVQVTIRATGKAVRARLEGNGHAVLESE